MKYAMAYLHAAKRIETECAYVHNNTELLVKQFFGAASIAI